MCIMGQMCVTTIFLVSVRLPPRPTLFPYTTLFRSGCTMPIVEQPNVQTCVPTLPHNGPPPPSLLVPLFLLNGHARRHPFPHHPFHPYDFFATSLAFGKGNKIAPLEKKEEEKEGEEGRYRLSPLSFSVYLRSEERRVGKECRSRRAPCH